MIDLFFQNFNTNPTSNNKSKKKIFEVIEKTKEQEKRKKKV